MLQNVLFVTKCNISLNQIVTKSSKKMDIKELNSKIPYGYRKIIAGKAGVSINSVSKFLNGKTKSDKIERATLRVLVDLSNQKNEMLKQIL